MGFEGLTLDEDGEEPHNFYLIIATGGRSGMDMDININININTRWDGRRAFL
jgi:hypothetical protein